MPPNENESKKQGTAEKSRHAKDGSRGAIRRRCPEHADADSILREDMLTELGCEIIGPAATVEQALKIIETAGVLHAAVLDINLNGVKSYPVADKLAARNVPFVFSTGYGRKSLRNGYSNSPLLQKPFSLQEISDAITELLSSKEPAVATE